MKAKIALTVLVSMVVLYVTFRICGIAYLLTLILTAIFTDSSAIALCIVGIILGFVLTVKASTDETDIKEALGYGLWMGVILAVYIMFWGKVNDVISVFVGSMIGSYICYSIRCYKKQ